MSGSVTEPRTVVFISKATPGDDEFTLWLAPRLEAAGYTVYADILRLDPGMRWRQELTTTLQSKAVKMLLCGRDTSLARHGVCDATWAAELPVAIETFDLNTPINRIVPLAPDLAIRIRPDVRLSRTPPDLSFAKFAASSRKLKQKEISDLNRSIVQCAEDLVLYRDDHAWIENFVAKNRRYRVESVTQTLKHDGGDLIVATHRIQTRPAA